MAGSAKTRGWKKILTRVVKNNTLKNYHTRLGRLSLQYWVLAVPTIPIFANMPRT